MRNKRHPFKAEINSYKVKIVKEKLREEVKAATQEYLNSGKSIEKIKDGPTAKVPSVGLKDLGNELFFGTGELYEAPDPYADMEIQLNRQLMEGDL